MTKYKNMYCSIGFILIGQIFNFASSCLRGYVPDLVPQVPLSLNKSVSTPWYYPSWFNSVPDEPHENYVSLNRAYSSQCHCGISNDVTDRTVQSNDLMDPELSWQAQLQVTMTDGIHLCSGTVINDKIILTAAHCVTHIKSSQPISPAKVKVLLNLHERGKGMEVKVSEIQAHPRFLRNFKKGYLDYDIALVRLEKRLDFSRPSASNPICLPSRIDQPIIHPLGKNLGLRNNSSNYSSRAFYSPAVNKLVEIQIKSLSVCKKFGPLYLTDHFICTGLLDESQDRSHHGASGGPLMTRTWKRRFQQIGIVSWGDYDYLKKHGIKTSSAILFTKVSDFLSFIDYFSDLHGAVWCSPE